MGLCLSEGYLSINCPLFYSEKALKAKKRLEYVMDFVQWIEEEKPDFACMESTGNH